MSTAGPAALACVAGLLLVACDPDYYGTGIDTGSRPATRPSSSSSPVASAPPPSLTPPPLISMQMQFDDAGDWLMSRTAGEGAPAYHYNGVQFRVFDTPPADAAAEPLYRCHDPSGTHFQTNDFNCEGVGTFESLLGYTYLSDPGNGALPILRCIGSSGHPIVATLQSADCAPFIVQNVRLGYAYLPSVETAPAVK